MPLATSPSLRTLLNRTKWEAWRQNAGGLEVARDTVSKVLEGIGGHFA